MRVSLHPAGHVLGSAQVRVEHRGRVWVASGDYFVSGVDGDINATCAPFEPVRCHCFITESTFGLPIYRWRAQAEVQREINAWWQANAEAGRASLLMGYSFGKAQRLLAGLDASIGPIAAHGAVENAQRGLPRRRRATAADAAHRRRCRAPNSGARSCWRRPRCRTAPGRGASAPTRATRSPAAGCSLRGARRRRGVDRGFVLSDHADWPGPAARDRAPPVPSA